jgi:enoyl-CoA hydratase
MNHLLVDKSRAVVTITINRPDAHNALDESVLADLARVLDGVISDASVRAVIITGSGEKAFSAGADLKELAAMATERAFEVLSAGHAVLRSLERAPVPVIAAVNGLALGGGFELVLAAIFPVLSTTASLGLPESGLGLMPGYGGTQRLPWAVGSRVAAHLMVTGTRLTAARAYDLGLTPIPPVAPESLMPTVREIAEGIAAQGPRAVRSILAALEAGRDATFDAGLALETELAAEAVGGQESSEGIAAFLERRTPRFLDAGVVL